MTERKTHHATFSIEKTYAAPVARVFQAFADQKAKEKWFAGPDEWERGATRFDFREGGREYVAGGPKGGTQHIFDCLYYDIVPNERIVYAYEMYLDTTRISVSITTIEMKAVGKDTKLVFTEQGVFLDGFDDSKGREDGSRWLLEKLGASLQKDVASA
ncbi:MAG TPA: SRPBCC family protein [Magnetospirillaceae bacterium]|jgi:uncharacterized protein YndB with AHSA1/START domain